MSFCIQCGAPLKEKDLFCTQCGALVNRSGENAQENIAIEKGTEDDPTQLISEPTLGEFKFKSALSSAFQWAMIWLIGWLPLGGIWYVWQDVYRLTSFSVGVFFGGFLAGFLIYKTLGRSQLSIGILGLIPVLAWAAIWGVFWIFRFIPFIPFQYMIYIFAPIFAMLVSHLAIELLHRKLDFSVTNQQRMRVALWWGVSGFLASITATKMGHFLWEIGLML